MFHKSNIARTILSRLTNRMGKAIVFLPGIFIPYFS
jgi:hypothetical protein